mmetsp:Transcript_115526/g.288678  ORF Transcript_115526/g.288678 Transcript_115526/m.288678 type:complete len:211 (+) Transcript_115526:691-1323(+)
MQGCKPSCVQRLLRSQVSTRVCPRVARLMMASAASSAIGAWGGARRNCSGRCLARRFEACSGTSRQKLGRIRTASWRDSCGVSPAARINMAVTTAAVGLTVGTLGTLGTLGRAEAEAPLIGAALGTVDGRRIGTTTPHPSGRRPALLLGQPGPRKEPAQRLPHEAGLAADLRASMLKTFVRLAAKVQAEGLLRQRVRVQPEAAAPGRAWP